MRNFSMSADFADNLGATSSCPSVYLRHFKYENEPYQVILNGQTGAVAGQNQLPGGKSG